jgi:uncharacterized protein YceK
MKKILLLLAVSFALSGCATNSETDYNSHPPSKINRASARLWIISAMYGSGTKYADVTYRVNGLIHQPGAEFFARPEWLHADPTPGWNKALVIVYEFKGRRRIFSTGEGGKVSAKILIRNTDKK